MTLDAGADDYLVKPFSTTQLEARIRAVLRRAAPPAEAPVIRVGALHVDPATREATLEGRDLALTRKEFDLLHFLAARGGRVATKKQLLAEVWNQPYGGADKTVDVHVSWLRRKLGETAAEPRYLRTVRAALPAQRRPFRLDLPRAADADVALSRDELEAAVDALVSNVFAHTPEGTAFRVALKPPRGSVRDWALVVEDEGPGPPAAGRPPQVRGTGLGLDIVRRTAERAGGTIELGRSAAGGFRVTVWFPAGAAADGRRGRHGRRSLPARP